MTALAVGCVLVGIAAISLAALLRVRGAVAFALAVAVISFAEVVVVSHALSALDAYERGWFLVTLTLVALATAGAAVIVRPAWPSLGRAVVVRDLFGDPVLAVLGAVVLAEVGYLLALALFTPPTEYDVLTYHLTRAVLWIQQGSIGPIPGVTDTRINDFPPNAELAQGMTVLLSRSLRWVGLVQMAALGVSVVAVYGIASRIGTERRHAAFGALVFATLPVVAMQAPTALNDLVVAALVATTVFFVLGRTRTDLALACVSASVLVGTKVTALIAAPVIVAIAVLVHRGRRLVALLAAGMAAAVAGGAWYAVNLGQGTGALGTTGRDGRGPGWLVRTAARASRYAVETIEAPGAFGRNTDLYLVGAAAIALVVWFLRAALVDRGRGRMSRRSARPDASRRARSPSRVLARLGVRRLRRSDAVRDDPRPDHRLEPPVLVRPPGRLVVSGGDDRRDATRVPRQPPVGGARDEVIDNRDAFEFLQDLVDSHDVTWESAGALRDGRKVFVSMRLPQTVRHRRSRHQ